MRTYPIFLTLAGRRVLVLGAGEAADRRAETFAALGAQVMRTETFGNAQLLEGCALAVGANAPEPDLAALSEAARSSAASSPQPSSIATRSPSPFPPPAPRRSSPA
jgi:uroporphyrin-III C-methyltransferase/precorrin-2 dehydrogenase/sirohydrochlorin ferrochelatase